MRKFLFSAEFGMSNAKVFILNLTFEAFNYLSFRNWHSELRITPHSAIGISNFALLFIPHSTFRNPNLKYFKLRQAHKLLHAIIDFFSR